MIEFLANNGYIIFTFMVLFAFGISLGMQFAKLPKEEQKKNVMEWLKGAVARAEKDFKNGGLGVLKLRTVYDAFLVKFPSLALVVPFETFKKWVDDALIWMKAEAEKNKNVDTYIKGE